MFFLKMPIKPVLIYPALNNCTDWSLSVGLYTQGNSNTEYTVLLKKHALKISPQVVTLREAPRLTTGPPDTRTHYSFKGKIPAQKAFPQRGNDWEAVLFSGCAGVWNQDLAMRHKCSTTELHCQHHAFQEQAGKSGLSGLKGNSSMCASVYVHMHACVCCLCVCVHFQE